MSRISTTIFQKVRMAVFAVTDKLFIYADQPTELLFQLDNLWIFHNVLTHLPIFRAGSNLRPRQITAFCSVAKLCTQPTAWACLG